MSFSIRSRQPSFHGLTPSQRPLHVRVGKKEISILISNDHWGSAEQLREEFNQSSLIESLNTEDLTKVELTAHFLKFITERADQDDIQSFYPLVKIVFEHLRDRYLKKNDVHAATRDLPVEARNVIIQAYFIALASLNRETEFDLSQYENAPSALFTAVKNNKASLFAVFGGQGANEDYFNEFVEVYSVYESILAPYVESMSQIIRELSVSEFGKSVHPKPLDILGWLKNPESRPDSQYLIWGAVSLPVIGLLQLSHYYLTMRLLGMTPDQFRQHFVGTTGHSQGIISSVVLASSSTEESFFENSEKALALLFIIGRRGHISYPQVTLNPSILRDSLANNEGNPSVMLSVANLPLATVQKYVESTNQHLPEDRQIYIGLVNGARFINLVGHPQSLYGLNTTLRKIKAPTGLDQSRVPHSQRKLKFSTKFIPITHPYHSDYLKQGNPFIFQEAKDLGIQYSASEIKVPVYSTFDGKNLQESDRVLEDLVEMICTLPIDWVKATNVQGLTHVIDFGPGGSSGIGGLTSRNKQGTGVQVIIANTLTGPNNQLSYKDDLFDSEISAVRYSANWAEEYRPKLVKTAKDGRVFVDTPMTRLFGKPPLMVAGMTPSTVSGEFVSAVMNAGYHVELAGGGHFAEKMIRDKVQMIMDSVPAGLGVSMNCLFLNSFLWNLQFPLIQQMRKEGFPMEGVCIGAGVPSPDVADEIVTQFHAAGIKHIAFKPGSVATIRQVVAIAARHPYMPIILQWTGGRAGGHHSFEDMHQPILETYGQIRAQKNIILLAGSGLGSAEDTLPYVTGDWALQFDYPPMPYDGVLFGSRVMIAKEGQAHDAVKQAIIDAPGIEDQDWEQTYTREAGGVLTVKSELGEPIHKIATRGVKLWKELDDTVFNLPREKRPAVLASKKDYIIKRLNADFQKVWFGKKTDGSAVDLEDMTYAEVANRAVELLYIKHQNRWIDISLRRFVGDFLRRIEERFISTPTESKLPHYTLLDKPLEFVPEFLANYPEASTQLLTSEDVQYFISQCLRRDQKPVPFIPVFDNNNFEFWFKKDSLWQSEDLDAVPDQDVQRVCILHGPVAAKHAKKINQPVKEILDEIHDGQVDGILNRYYQGNLAQVPTVEYLGGPKVQYPEEIPKGIISRGSLSQQGTEVYDTESQVASLPDAQEWLHFLAGPKESWLHAFLTSSAFVRGKRYFDNPMSRVFRPRPSQRVFVKSHPEFTFSSLAIHDIQGTESRSALEVSTNDGENIEFTLFEHLHGKAVPLAFSFKYHPQHGYASIEEIMTERNARIKDLYGKLWFGDELPQDLVATPEAEFTIRNQEVKREDITKFCQVVGNLAELYVDRDQEALNAPLDYAIRLGWLAIIKTIFPKEIDGDLLKLVHLSNGFRQFDNVRPLQSGDVVDCVAKILALKNTASGKVVKVRSVIQRGGVDVMEINSQFLYRGKFNDFEHTFEVVEETPVEVVLDSAQSIAVLKSKSWFSWDHSEISPSAGNRLIFRLNTIARFKSQDIFSHVQTKGQVTMQVSTKEFVNVASVDFEAFDSHGNPVLDYLKRHGQSIEQAQHFENGGYSVMPTGEEFSASVRAPNHNSSYSEVSTDYNPIHVNPYFADLAELPGTITHGMWTSASTRKFVETFAAENKPLRVTSYDVSFLGMVLPSDQLETKLFHVGMQHGKRIIKVETFNQNGAKVLEGTAEVVQANTAYVFTGQGSQEPGMGMALYGSSPVAKAIWDAADKHFLKNYGFSILDIVRNNPKEKTIYFGGAQGKAIRQNYMAMTYDTVNSEGQTQTLPLFPDISEKSKFYTFKSPNGLLSATQFTQPALTLVEKAAFEDMVSKGVVQVNAPFAGHSLGEYAALASIGNVLPIESLVDLVFYRGMTMQSAVERDELGRSDYGMVAVNPSRISKSLTETYLRYLVDSISHETQSLLEIVNFNVENWQYVVSGSLTCLDVLANVLNYLKSANIDLAKLMKSMSVDELKQHLSKIIHTCLAKSLEKKTQHGFINLERGYATIPLPGIDVPFHSRFLLSGVVPFRNYIVKKLNPTNIDVNQLSGKYIPNLVAEPFKVTKDYFELIHKISSSPKIAKVLKNWDEEYQDTPAHLQKLGYIALVELLTYQFASPVRWIETQDQLFKNFGVERLIEIGPSPTLCGMADRTLKFKYEAYDDALTFQRVNLCYSRNEKEIYYAFESEVEEAPKAEAPKAAATPALVAAAPAPAPVAAPVRAAGPVADEPLKATDVLHVVIAQKLKKSLADIPLSKSIKDLVAGKSTLQNEILGDLQKEFGNNVPEKPEETPLTELGASLGNAFSGNLGKHTTGLVSKLVASKMPGGFNLTSIKSHLSSSYGLGAGRTEGVLLHALIHEPASRLGSEGDAKSWLDTVTQSYASKSGVSLSAGASAPAAAAPVAVAAAASAGPAASVPDAPVTALEVLHIIIAQKLKKKVTDIPTSKAIKDLVGGKSTLQNEILGDLQKEFGNAVPEKPEETPLTELAGSLSNSFSGSLGKHTSGLINRVLGSKLPGGFTQSNARDYLGSTYGLGSGRTDSVLLLSLTLEPASRLGSPADAHSWLDSVVSAYTQYSGVSLSAGGSGSAGPAAVGGAVMNSAEFDALVKKQNNYYRHQIELLYQYLGEDLYESNRDLASLKTQNIELQQQIDDFHAEHGEFYVEGIKPVFDSKKVRVYDSYWNWSRQDAISLYYDIIFGKLTAVDRDITARCIQVMNRADATLVDFMKYHIENCPAENGPNYKLAKDFGQMLIQNCEQVLNNAPVYKDVTVPKAPKTTIGKNGDIVYEEVERENIRKLAHYVKEMAAGSKLTEFPSNLKVQQNLNRIYKVVSHQPRIKKAYKEEIKGLYNEVVGSLALNSSASKSDKPGKARRVAKPTQRADKMESLPFLHLKKKDEIHGYEYSSQLTSSYLQVLSEIANEGVTFQNKYALITGCGKNSIGAEILKGLLSGGANVIVTTSRFSKSGTEYYQSIYQQYGSRGSSLIVLPYNQGSKQDTDALVDYIYNKDEKKGLGWDLDFVIPFAALPENGREISDIDGVSEFAHRVMLTNLLRLIGAIKTKKEELGYHTRPAQVMLPLSPNHGLFGKDGLYSESKISLENLLNRWYAESWGSYLTIVGTVIGWTRGTGLMSQNNIVSEGVEKLGVRTFSTQEMSFNILGLMHPTIVNLAQIEPVWADLNGGFQFLPNFKDSLSNLRNQLTETSVIRKAIATENAQDHTTVNGDQSAIYNKHKSLPRANLKFEFPKLKEHTQFNNLKQLQGMLDLEKVVVVTGYSEVGPWGNARTRWEMEAHGEFSLEGCIEMAWMMGLIKHHNGPLKAGGVYTGWVDAKSGQPVEDSQVKAKYEEHILKHSGIRLVEPELFDGYDPNNKTFYREVVIDHDLEPIELPEEEAEDFKKKHGDKVDIIEVKSTGQFLAKFRRGASLYIPKALQFDRLVAGQVPTGWDPKRYGLPEDIVQQVDNLSLFVLVSTAEALVSAGITDPYEFYKYIHVTEIGNTSGSGIGGMASLKAMYKDRMFEKPVQSDILQEVFINTLPAWVNLLLLSSSGPIKTPVGACATAVESVEIGVDTIMSGKAKVVVVGGFDDFGEEGSEEFANMKATSNTFEEFAKGRTPSEMSRPATTSRAGFMESQGSGIQILMSAKVAIEMGVPVYSIVALTNTATDKEGRSVPAPGQGILTTAREAPTSITSPLLNINYRSRQLAKSRREIKRWVEEEFEELKEEVELLKSEGQLSTPELEKEFLDSRTSHISKEAERKEKAALNTYGNQFYVQDPTISPIRGALASFGLTVDDIGVASFHGTSTKANDKNESDVVDKQFRHLGRKKGNTCPSVFQKYLTGHPKGAAAAWMLNGAIQMLNTGIIPGNRNADNIDLVLKKFEYVLYLSKTIQTDGIKAALVKSFGFGQVGGEVLLIHPDYLYAALTESEYNEYKVKYNQRQAKAYRYFHNSLTGVSSFIQIKNSAPYTPELESAVYLNPTARASYDAKTKSYSFKTASAKAPQQPFDYNLTKDLLASFPLNNTDNRGVGVDVELVSAINIDNETFIERNFTPEEIAYCQSRPDPNSSFAGKWAAKESVIKAVSSFSLHGEKVWTQGAGAPLKDIEITIASSGAPEVVFHGDALEASKKAGVAGVKVSISHSGEYALAMSIAN